MRLTVQTDYALRMMMFLAVSDQHQTIEAVARHYGISKNHLMKVAQKLASQGFVKSVRGRGGGLALARPAHEINLGNIVRMLEETSLFVECFDLEINQCVVTPVCGLRHILAGSINAFLKHLDQYTVADLVRNPLSFRAALGLPVITDPTSLS